MALDSIVTLAAAMAETPGGAVLLLGAGMSRDAGVPTTWDIELEVLRAIYSQEHPSAETPGDEDLVAWRDAHAELRGAGYSRLMETLYEQPATRRDFLAKKFEGRTPGRSHRGAARLVADGHIRVIVTTNFDRLLELALLEVGITATVVTTADELARREPREHAVRNGCFVLKVNGDYLEQTILNTEDELDADLAPEIAAELDAILQRHNVLAIGYAGRDKAIVDALARRRDRSRYGVWWHVMSDPTEPVTEVTIDLAAARKIIRGGGAAEMLADLGNRLAIYKAHPSGHTPASVEAEVLQLLQRGDRVELDETLRRERRAYETALAAAATSAAANADGFATPPWTVFERRAAALLPLALHDAERLADEVQSMPATCEARETSDLARWGTWAILYLVGGVLATHRRWEAMEPLLTIRWRADDERTQLLVAGPGPLRPNPGEAFRELELWTQSMPWLGERYPELVTPASAAIARFDVTVTAARLPQSDDGHIYAFWTASTVYEIALATLRQIVRSDDAQRILEKAAKVGRRSIPTELTRAFNPNPAVQPALDTRLTPFRTSFDPGAVWQMLLAEQP